MSEQKHNNPEAVSVPPHRQLLEMAAGYRVSQIVYVAAKLALADHLADGPKSAAELAPLTNTHPKSLYRLLRILASLDIVSAEADQRFTLTALGEALKSDAPGLARPGIMSLVSQRSWRAWEALPQVIETGQTGMEIAWGMPLFEYLTQHPEEAGYFSAIMANQHSSEQIAVAAAYDFSALATIVDIGGATGNFLAEILTRYPGPHGVLFDLPHVVQDAPPLIAKRGLTERISIEAGSFFERIPAGGDAYLISDVIHDWSEDQCLTILENCHRVMKPDSKLLLVEVILPDDDRQYQHPGWLKDFIMLVLTGGEERTAAEYGALLEKGGFRMLRVVPTESPVSIIEAVPA